MPADATHCSAAIWDAMFDGEVWRPCESANRLVDRAAMDVREGGACPAKPKKPAIHLNPLSFTLPSGLLACCKLARFIFVPLMNKVTLKAAARSIAQCAVQSSALSGGVPLTRAQVCCECTAPRAVIWPWPQTRERGVFVCRGRG